MYIIILTCFLSLPSSICHSRMLLSGMTGGITVGYASPKPVDFSITRANTRFTPTPVLYCILAGSDGENRLGDVVCNGYFF
ncbi:MAG: hypothetical protein NG784_10340 [Candidatus Jettenia sp.]|nr:hypothetical protein [Candidatus Jettenia sp.]